MNTNIGTAAGIYQASSRTGHGNEIYVPWSQQYATQGASQTRAGAEETQDQETIAQVRALNGLLAVVTGGAQVSKTQPGRVLGQVDAALRYLTQGDPRHLLDEIGGGKEEVIEKLRFISERVYGYKLPSHITSSGGYYKYDSPHHLYDISGKPLSIEGNTQLVERLDALGLGEIRTAGDLKHILTRLASSGIPGTDGKKGQLFAALVNLAPEFIAELDKQAVLVEEQRRANQEFNIYGGRAVHALLGVITQSQGTYNVRNSVNWALHNLANGSASSVLGMIGGGDGGLDGLLSKLELVADRVFNADLPEITLRDDGDGGYVDIGQVNFHHNPTLVDANGEPLSVAANAQLVEQLDALGLGEIRTIFDLKKALGRLATARIGGPYDRSGPKFAALINLTPEFLAEIDKQAALSATASSATEVSQQSNAETILGQSASEPYRVRVQGDILEPIPSEDIRDRGDTSESVQSALQQWQVVARNMAEARQQWLTTQDEAIKAYGILTVAEMGSDTLQINAARADLDKVVQTLNQELMVYLRLDAEEKSAKQAYSDALRG